MAKVSIVLPTYNGARYLRASIDSCLGQTYCDIELIVVDDGSTDETLKILESYDDPRLTVVRHDKNRGLPAALNTGFAHTAGRYLTWTSDDNYYAPGAIATLVRYLVDHLDVDFVYSGCWLIDEHGEIIGERKMGSPEDLREFNSVGPCFMYRRQVYETIGDYNVKATLSEDYEYWMRVSQKFHMEFLDGLFYYKRLHSGSLSATDYGTYRARRVALRARRKLLGLPWQPYAEQTTRAFIDEAFASYRQNDMPNALRALVLGLLHDWRWLGNRGLLSIIIKAFAGPWLSAAVRRLGKHVGTKSTTPSWGKSGDRNREV